MKYLFVSFCVLFLYISAFAQTKAPVCYCPTASKWGPKYEKGTKANRIFDLGNGQSIALCGYAEKKLIRGKTLYSEFVLSACGSADAIGVWGALETCNIETANDTLLVNILKLLPATPKATETYFTWTTERFYYTQMKLKRTITINPELPKYSPTQIGVVLSLYDQHNVNDNSDAVAELADKLLLCALSGSKQAENDLRNFSKKFKNLDGATAESYDNTYRMFQLWQKQGFKSVEVK
jgi:hypothetical protein